MAYRPKGLGGKTTSGREWYQGDLRDRTKSRVYVDGRGEGGNSLRVPEHHLGQLSQQARQRASAGATTRMNSSPSTTRPGTQSPSQPQRDLPGTRNFSLFGGVYTWSKAQEDKDAKDPNFNGGARENVLKNAAPAAVAAKPAVAGKPVAPAAGAGTPWNSESYELMAMELASSGEGSKVFAGPAAKAATQLTRTADANGMIEFRPGIMYRPPSSGSSGPASATSAPATIDTRDPDALWQAESVKRISDKVSSFRASAALESDLAADVNMQQRGMAESRRVGVASAADSETQRGIAARDVDIASITPGTPDGWADVFSKPVRGQLAAQRADRRLSGNRLWWLPKGMGGG